MIYVRSTVAAIVVGSLAFSALGQVDENARQALTKSAEAIKNLKDVSGTSRHYATGPIVGGTVDTRGEFKLIKGATADASASFFKGQAKAVAGENHDPFHFFLNPGESPATVTWVDDINKTVYTRPLQVRTDAFNQKTLGQQLLITELFEAEPFKKTLGSEKVALEGNEKVGEEACDIIRASMKQGWTLWHISSKDSMPRRFEMGVKLDGQEEPVRLIYEWTDVKVNQNLTRKDLEIAVPAGYRVDEQKAPPVANADPNAAPDAPPPPRPELGPGQGSPAPTFELRTGKGEEKVKLADLKGNVVVLAFWGTWNGKAKDSLPVLDGVAKAFAGKPVKVFGAACREKGDEAPMNFFKEKGYGFGLLLGADEVAKGYKVRGFPSFVVIDPAGNTAAFLQSYQNEDSLREKLTEAVRTALGEEKQ